MSYLTLTLPFNVNGIEAKIFLFEEWGNLIYYSSILYGNKYH